MFSFDLPRKIKQLPREMFSLKNAQILESYRQHFCLYMTINMLDQFKIQ